LMQRQKSFLSLYVSGLQVYVHLYDDLSADATVEVGGFGARNTMAPYQNPASKEHAWAEVITPIVHEPNTSAVRDEHSPSSIDSTVPGSNANSPIESSLNRDTLLSIHAVKREQYNAQTRQSMFVVQHLEVNLHPLNIRATYETIAAIVQFFVIDQQQYTKTDNTPSGSDGESRKAASQRRKRRHHKYKSKFLPGGGQILEMEQAMKNVTDDAAQSRSSALQAATVAAAAAAASGGGGGGGSSNELLATPSKQRSASISASNSARESGRKRSIFSSIKHSRVISAAKDFFTHSESQTQQPPQPSHSDLYDHDSLSVSSLLQPPSPSSILSPVSTTRSRHRRSNSDDAQSRDMDSTALSAPNSARNHTLSSYSSGGSVGRASSSSSASHRPHHHHRSSMAPRLIQFVYVRFGSTQFLVSYWGNKQQSTNNIEDFQGLKIKFKQIVFQKKMWTIKKFGNQIKKEIIRNLLGQVSATLGGFISYKLGFRPAEQTNTTGVSTNTTTTSSSTAHQMTDEQDDAAQQAELKQMEKVWGEAKQRTQWHGESDDDDVSRLGFRSTSNASHTGMGAPSTIFSHAGDSESMNTASSSAFHTLSVPSITVSSVSPPVPSISSPSPAASAAVKGLLFGGKAGGNVRGQNGSGSASGSSSSSSMNQSHTSQKPKPNKLMESMKSILPSSGKKERRELKEESSMSMRRPSVSVSASMVSTMGSNTSSTPSSPQPNDESNTNPVKRLSSTSSSSSSISSIPASTAAAIATGPPPPIPPRPTQSATSTSTVSVNVNGNASGSVGVSVTAPPRPSKDSIRSQIVQAASANSNPNANAGTDAAQAPLPPSTDDSLP